MRGMTMHSLQGVAEGARTPPLLVSLNGDVELFLLSVITGLQTHLRCHRAHLRSAPPAHSGIPAASISSRNSCARLADSRPWRKDRISVGRTLTKSATTLKLYPCRVVVF
jgi:hypothetical protein